MYLFWACLNCHIVLYFRKASVVPFSLFCSGLLVWSHRQLLRGSRIRVRRRPFPNTAWCWSGLEESCVQGPGFHCFCDLVQQPWLLVALNLLGRGLACTLARQCFITYLWDLSFSLLHKNGVLSVSVILFGLLWKGSIKKNKVKC